MLRRNFIYGHHLRSEAEDMGAQLFKSWREIYEIPQACQIGIFQKLPQPLNRIQRRSQNQIAVKKRKTGDDKEE